MLSSDGTPSRLHRAGAEPGPAADKHAEEHENRAKKLRAALVAISNTEGGQPDEGAH